MVEGALLSALDIAEEGAGHADQGLPRFQTETTEGTDAQHPPQAFLSRRGRKCFGRNRSYGRRRHFRWPDALPAVPVVGDQDLLGPQAREVFGQHIGIRAANALEDTGADFDPGQRRGIVVATESGKVSALHTAE